MRINPHNFIEECAVDFNQSFELTQFIFKYVQEFPEFILFAEEFEQEAIDFKTPNLCYLLMLVSVYLSDFVKGNCIRECETHLDYIEDFLCKEESNLKQAVIIHFLDGFLNQFLGTDLEPLVLNLIEKRKTLQVGKVALDSFWGLEYT